MWLVLFFIMITVCLVELSFGGMGAEAAVVTAA